MKRRVPRQLVRGRRFHDRIRAAWAQLIPGKTSSERGVAKFGDRRGRIDIWLDADDDYAVVFEIKSTDWDRIIRSRAREYLRRHGMQVHDYLAGTDLLERNSTLYIVYPRAPKDHELRDLVETGMLSMGITVFWWAEQISPAGGNFPPILGANWR
jgi:hypothetical protein